MNAAAVDVKFRSSVGELVKLPAMNVWRLKTHHDNPTGALAWIRKNQKIALGWGLIGDLNQRGYNSAAKVGAAMRQHYPNANNTGSGGPSVWNFYDQLKIGDLVILSALAPRVLVVEVVGNYEFDNHNAPVSGEYWHQRAVKVTIYDPHKLWHLAGAREALGDNIRRPLTQCAVSVDPNDL